MDEQSTAELPAQNKLQYNGVGNELAMLMFKNIFLSIITLGIYTAWGRTNSRRYKWEKTSFLGDQFIYTGKGDELFRGWIILSVIYIVSFVFINILAKYFKILGIAVIPLYIYLYTLIIYSGARYRLSRTKWRGIHFGMDKNKKSTRDFILLSIKNTFFTILTLGFYYPYHKHNVRKFLVDKSRFGNEYFQYEADAREYFFINLKGFLLTVITLGFYSPWFIINIARFKLKHIKLGNLSFELDVTGIELFLYSLKSYIISILTLGIATPWIINRGIHLFLNNVIVKGDLNFDRISAVASEGSALADMAATDYDIDLGF
jgi:uncharacterized membrane protein YjgN (DUF898 family)